jgi:opacity protein-like surface antigen
MKHYLGILLLAAPLAAQNISLGIKGGVPFTEAFKTSGGPTFNYKSLRNPYTVGPSLEVRLPLRLSVSIDILWKRLEYEGTSASGELNVKSNQFEFPVMVKYRFKEGLWTPYVAAGPSFNKITGVTRTITNPSQFLEPDEFKDSSSGGFAFGAGLEFKPVVRITTELRWTRRGSKNFFSASSGLLESNLNQAEFLVGLHF